MSVKRSVLSFDHQPGSPEVVVSRDPNVPELLWMKVQTEWGTSGRSPSTSVNVPTSVFLSRLDWVTPYCRQHGVKVEWNGTAEDLVRHRLADYLKIGLTCR